MLCAGSAIRKVNDKPHGNPDAQSHPVSPAESINHRAADKDAEDSHNRQCRHPETPFQVGAPNPHYPDTQADQNKREQRPDAGHVTDDIFGNKGGENAGEDEEEQV